MFGQWQVFDPNGLLLGFGALGKALNVVVGG